ncbi:hypothetical protein D3C78_1582870 [compost metagenome]
MLVATPFTLSANSYTSEANFNLVTEVTTSGLAVVTVNAIAVLNWLTGIVTVTPLKVTATFAIPLAFAASIITWESGTSTVVAFTVPQFSVKVRPVLPGFAATSLSNSLITSASTNFKVALPSTMLTSLDTS